MTRILSHHLLYCGKTYHMSVAEISDDGRRCQIKPFESETANTVFINGTVEIARDSHGRYAIKTHTSQPAS